MKNLDEMNKYDRRDLLVLVAEEIQEVCPFEPPIRTEKKSEEELVALLKEAYVELTPDDEQSLSERTISVFEQLKFTKPTTAGSKQQEEDSIEEAEVVDESGEEEEGLMQEIEGAKQLNVLKKIARTRDEFKSLRGTKYTFDALKKAMLEIVANLEAATPAEEDALKEEEEVEEAKEKSEMKVSKPLKKEPTPSQKEKSSGKKVSLQEKIDFFIPLIRLGKYSQVELGEKGVVAFPTLSIVTIRTFLSDSKNEKYNKFPDLVVVNKKGNLEFEE